MSGRNKVSKLLADMPVERRDRIATLAAKMDGEMSLAQLRVARERSQASIAAVLNVEQPAVAKLEKRTDMYVSNLRRFIEAMGGELEINAKFDGQTVKITNFSDLAAE